MDRHEARDAALEYWRLHPDLTAADVARHMEAQGCGIAPGTLRQWKRRHLSRPPPKTTARNQHDEPAAAVTPDERPAAADEPAAFWVDVHSVAPWPDNPRDNEHAIPYVAKSIRRFGYGRTWVAWQSAGARMIVVGHTAREAVLSNLEQHPGECPPGAPAPNLIPVRWRDDWSEHEAIAYAIADNKTGELAGWVDEQLATHLRELDQHDIAAEVLGFADDEIDRLMGELEQPPGGGSDDAPDPPEVDPLSKPGEVYRLGPHRLACGDCTDQDVIDRLFEGESARLVLTDPPYSSGGQQEAQRTHGSVGRRGGRHGHLYTVRNDNLTSEGLASLLEKAIGRLPCHGIALVFTDWRQLQTTRRAIEGLGFSYRSLIVWVKESAGLGWPCRHQHELIYLGVRDWPKTDGGGDLPDVQQVNRVRAGEHHTQKPVELLQRLIAATPDGLVADPFAGSGSTLIAAAAAGRAARVVEIDPLYCDVIRTRWHAWATEQGVDPGPDGIDPQADYRGAE